MRAQLDQFAIVQRRDAIRVLDRRGPVRDDDAGAALHQPSAQTVCAGSLATFVAAANGFLAPTVQWQVSPDGGTNWNNIPGATSTTLSLASPDPTCHAATLSLGDLLHGGPAVCQP